MNHDVAYLQARLAQAVSLAQHITLCQRQHCRACREAADFFLSGLAEQVAWLEADQAGRYRRALEEIAAGCPDAAAVARQALWPGTAG